MSIASLAHLPGRCRYTSMVGMGYSLGACRVRGLFPGPGSAVLDARASLHQ